MEEPESTPPESTESPQTRDTSPQNVLYPRFFLSQNPEDRNYVPWLLLFAIFSLLIVTTVASLRKPAIQTDAYFQDVEAVKQVIRQKRMGELIPARSLPTDSLVVPPDIVADLRSKAAKDKRAARLLVEAEFESSGKVPAEDIDRVAATKQPVDLDFATVYRAKTLTEAQARQLTAKFPIHSIARVHAFDKAGDPGPRNAMSPQWKIAASLVVGFLAFCALGVGCVLWVIFFALRADGRLPAPQHPAEPLSYPEADRFAYRAVLLVTAFFLISVFASTLKRVPIAEYMFILYGAMLVAVVLLHKIPAMGLRIPLSRVGVTSKDLGKNIGYGLAAYVMSLPGLAVAALIGLQLAKVFGQHIHPAAEMAGSNPNLPTILALYFSASIVAPFWEEIMFRGTLLPALARVLGKPLWGILLSSFMFAAIHPQGIPMWLGLGFIGAMSGMLSYQTRSLVPSMVLHAVNNAIAITVVLLVS